WWEASEQYWHNPSSLYREAGMAKQELERCREEVADFLELDEPERILFTSGATEANNAALRHLAENRAGRLLVSSVEHPCVEAPAQAWFGPERCVEIPVEEATGVVALDVIAAELRKGDVAAVSVMAANNETGTLQPWQEISRLAKEEGVPFHTDAAQWIGKLPADGLGECEYLTGSAHKFGGGKGIGFLVLPEDEDFHGFIGGPQEEGRRAGTENLPAVLAMVAALEARPNDDLKTIASARSRDRDGFEERVASIGMKSIGASGSRLWNTAMLLLPHSINLKWLTRLSQRGFSVSTGSACSAGRGNPSRVMAAMGLEFEEMGRVLRVSGGWETTEKDWMSLADALEEVGRELAQ
ncbi:MAG: aminotransferase class V-fold PLP-dependent enzyme, partial [Verrucomicrobiota bacterium]